MMRLFIWDRPYPVPFGASIAFAVAENVEQAREIAAKSTAYRWTSEREGWTPPELGEPSRVLDLPCAEWHEFEP